MIDLIPILILGSPLGGAIRVHVEEILYVIGEIGVAEVPSVPELPLKLNGCDSLLLDLILVFAVIVHSVALNEI